jgi:pimeloyl-ACP methyl ester carboxylesterase
MLFVSFACFVVCVFFCLRALPWLLNPARSRWSNCNEYWIRLVVFYAQLGNFSCPQQLFDNNVFHLFELPYQEMENVESKTIVLVHGMFMTSLCWDGWIGPLERAGHKVIAPNWPNRDLSVAEQKDEKTNKDYLTKLGSLGLQAVVDHFVAIVKGLPEKPVLIGHSMGDCFCCLFGEYLLNYAKTRCFDEPAGYATSARSWSSSHQ